MGKAVVTGGWVGQTVMANLFADFAQTLLGDYDVHAILDGLTARVGEVVPVDGAGVMLEDDAGNLRFAAASDEVVRGIESLQIELTEGPCVAAYLRGEQVLLTDLADCAEFPEFAPRALQLGLAAVFSFPMWHQGQRLGALNLYGVVSTQLTGEQIAAAQTLADVATVYLLHARQRRHALEVEQQLREYAITDPLTSLANRRLLLDHLDLAVARSARTGRKVAVIFIDLDGFKAVNDRLGHAAGDRLLIEAAGRIRISIREADTAARPGGDEFAVICEDLLSPGDAMAVAARILSSLQAPFRIDEHQLTITASIGVAVDGRHGVDALLSNADTAMYTAKRAGGNRVERFLPASPEC